MAREVCAGSVRTRRIWFRAGHRGRESRVGGGYSERVPASRFSTTAAAAALTALAGLGIAGVAVAVLATRWATFSLGIAAVLLIYAALVIVSATLLWRRQRFGFGAAVAAALLHLMVLANYAFGDHGALFAALAVVPVATLVSLLVPSTRREFGRA